MRYSQCLSELPLLPWLIATKDVFVKSDQCTCMAGLIETCTHVAAILFWVEIRLKTIQSKTLTNRKAYWFIPHSFKIIIPEK